jgi:hypothetical protein
MNQPDHTHPYQPPSAIAELVAEEVRRQLADPPAELLDAICARLGERVCERVDAELTMARAGLAAIAAMRPTSAPRSDDPLPPESPEAPRP